MENQITQRQQLTSLQPREKKVLTNLLTSPEVYCEQLRPKNLNDVFEAPDLSLSVLNNEISIVGVRAVLSIMVGRVVKFFNVGKTMDDQQVAITCDLIIDAFPYFKLEDLSLCFKKAMLLEYGKLYDRIDGAIIIEWLKKYAAGRDEYASILSESKAVQDNCDNSNNCFYGDYLANLKQRAENGDDEAQKHLEGHLSLKTLLKRDESGYKDYMKDREYKRLHGRI